MSTTRRQIIIQAGLSDAKAWATRHLCNPAPAKAIKQEAGRDRQLQHFPRSADPRPGNKIFVFGI